MEGGGEGPLQRTLTREAASCSSGTTAVYTRFPFTTSRISMESVVKAKMYGNAHTGKHTQVQVGNKRHGYMRRAGEIKPAECHGG